MRSKIIENHSIQIEGILDVTTSIITMDIENIGVKTLQELLLEFGGKEVKITVRLSEETIVL